MAKGTVGPFNVVPNNWSEIGNAKDADKVYASGIEGKKQGGEGPSGRSYESLQGAPQPAHMGSQSDSPNKEDM